MKEYRIIECCMQRTCMGIYPDLKSAKEIREQAMTIVSDIRLRDYKIE